MTRKYSSISIETTLNNGINTTATTVILPSIAAATALMGGVTLDAGNVDIFTVAIDHDTINEEIVYVTGISGDTLTVSRGRAGTGTAGVSGIAHSAGASIKHVLTSDDLTFYTTGVATADAAVTLTGTQTLTNKTLTSPAINTATIAGGTITDAIVRGLEEDVNIVASAATGTINFDVSTASVWYYTSNATANHTLNFRYSSGVSLNTAMATGDAITLVWLNTNGATPYYPNVINIDGSAVTPKVPAAISAGNASAIDAYSFTIIKTASATFTVLETQTKFA